MKRTALYLALAAAGVLALPAAEARITRIEITQTESPTFGGYSWPGVGQYEKIVGKAYGEVNPRDRRNRVIVDIELAPTNARGNVEYAFNFYILKPIDQKKGARKVMYEPPNRGGKTWAGLARMPGGNDPGSVTDPAVLANAFFMPRGYTMAWSGWEELGSLDSLTGSAVFPIAKNRDGSTITGPSYEYIVTGGTSFTLAYPAADVNAPATLTHRVHLDDEPQTVARAAPGVAGWQYTDATGTAIRLVNAAGATVNFVNNDIYEFSYTAKDPSVKGLGFAAVRDFNAFLRYEKRDDYGNPNPLAGYVDRIYTEVLSQPGRLLNDFRTLGFNEAENGKKVFDGHLQWIAAANGLNLNYRFSQSGRTERNRQNHLYIEGRFPFANVRSHDPITRETASRYDACEKTRTCPYGMEIYSSNEYWVKAASLLHTDPAGRHDLPDSPYTRNYLISGQQHGTGNPNNRGACQQFQNPLNSFPVQRALWEAMEDWVEKGKKPPASRVPKLKDRTLVPPLPQAGMGFPEIPGVTYTGLMTTRYLYNYGLHFYETGIATINPPFAPPPYQNNPAHGPIYPAYVPKTDSDGNEIAGVRLPDVTVPLATYTGWALRSGVWANDGCEAAGQYIPFPRTEAERAMTGDPRPSVEARYPSFAAYHSKVRKALNDMVENRLLLCEDAAAEEARLMQHGLTRGVPAPEGGVLSEVETLKACKPHKHDHGHGHGQDHGHGHGHGHNKHH